jgi:hypothetical protein
VNKPPIDFSSDRKPATDAAFAKNPARNIVSDSSKQNLMRMKQQRRLKSFLRITFPGASDVVSLSFPGPW